MAIVQNQEKIMSISEAKTVTNPLWKRLLWLVAICGGKRASAGLRVDAVSSTHDSRGAQITLSAQPHTKMIELCYQAVTSLQVTYHDRN